MVRVLLYWSNICVLNKSEIELLRRAKEDLLRDGIELEVRFFGLGYPLHMSDYLRAADAIIPDMILSTDLEVFEDERVYKKIENELIDASMLYRNTIKEIERPMLLPYLSIPLMLFSKDKEGLSFKDLKNNNAAFGGINNSAAKSVVKTVWSLYGKAEAEALLKSSFITPMPIGAFQSVRAGQRKAAVIPSLFALSDTSFISSPLKEGVLSIPSYISVRNTIDKDVASRIIERLNGNDFIKLYEEQGKMLMSSKDAPVWYKALNTKLVLPLYDFLSNLDSTEFYDLYCKYIPSAAKY